MDDFLDTEMVQKVLQTFSRFSKGERAGRALAVVGQIPKDEAVVGFKEIDLTAEGLTIVRTTVGEDDDVVRAVIHVNIVDVAMS